MRVLVLSGVGMGLYKFRKEILEELVKQGHEVFVSFPKDEYVPLIEELGCTYFESKLDRRGTNPLLDMNLILFYTKLIKKIKPDAVLTFTTKSNIYGSLACRVTKTDYLPSITGLGTAIENEGVMQKFMLFMYKMGFKDAKNILFHNNSNRKFFIKKRIVKDNTILVSGSGVNLENFKFEEYPEDDNLIKFLFIGRIMKAKGIDEFIETAKRIKETHENVEFHMVGFCEEEYLEQLNALNDQGTIYYHGKQNDVHSFIKNSHATVLPSYHEGISNVLLESAAIGRPLLTTYVPGCQETFDEGITGLGFESKSSDALFNAIEKFIKLPYEDKKAMGLAGRKKMEKEFDRKSVVNAYVEQIHKCK